MISDWSHASGNKKTGAAPPSQKLNPLEPQFFEMQYGVRPVGDSCLAVYLADIILNGADSQKKRLRDFLIAFPLHQQPDDLLLPRRKVRKRRFRSPLPMDMLCDFCGDIARQNHASPNGVPDGFRQLRPADIFKEIPRSAVGDGAKYAFVIVKGGQHQNGCFGNIPLDQARSLNAAHLRHSDIHENDMRAVDFRLFISLLTVFRFRNHPDIQISPEKRTQAVPDNSLIVCYEDRDLVHGASSFLARRE